MVLEIKICSPAREAAGALRAMGTLLAEAHWAPGYAQHHLGELPAEPAAVGESHRRAGGEPGAEGKMFCLLVISFFFFFRAWLVCMYVFLQDWYQRSR